ncbi:hypothetical protein CONPUDRAFT_112021 [Coniophora puteana RWD-64-598 SS2]|uniref:RNI-like protein n=1 Tax=Coniophora puteana (strain RWD-64-598) TaxID=741705 RepID=A0A5M3M8P4_CONPW|nr:uncharacterized protein CONPUDRAFT_112021 [Coniophora puteana RWD-64-598 SS2]EIW75443.1 hypothetical protein CONPUDRAFT_112021 [Coniophora puteana RWD-64-598 SS2]
MSVLPSSSGPPSSSAVTIPRAGKSILKRPPPQQTGLISRIKGFLPTNANAANATSTTASDDTRALKRAHFILPHLVTVYPISTINPPSMPTLKDEKLAIEEREAERRRRIVRGNSFSGSASDVSTMTLKETDEWWNMDKVESFYRECCESREEQPDPAVTAAFKRAANTEPRSVDLSGVQLTPTSAAILSDVFTIEWGLRKLTLRECDLDEHTLKPMLHSLLIPNTLVFLSVASNRRLKIPAFKLVSAYVSRAKSLQFLDLSQNALDKKAMEYIASVIPQLPAQGIISLRLDDCQLKPPALDVLARAVRNSSLRNISLRHNKINQSGAVALAIMIRDYPDAIPSTSPSPSSPPLSTSSLLAPSSGSGTPQASPATSFASLPLSLSSFLSPPPSPMSPSPSLLPGTGSPNPGTPTSPSTPLPPPLPHGPGKTVPPRPPPRHPSMQPPQTTYTPYIPRSRRNAPPPGPSGGGAGHPPLSASGQPMPVITSNTAGGITTRHDDSHAHAQARQGRQGANGTSHAAAGLGMGSRAGVPPGAGNRHGQGQGGHGQGPSAALLDKVRALDALPRLGALRTLDLRGNDLKTGISYLAQVLKRNRTLKVLNLSDNKLDVGCLVAVAEALKYNLSLETLDLSRNPCAGPALDGIQSLRTAFTLNTALKRLFLSSTGLTSAAAIALAEFLPESASLLHLDLTLNNLDIAAVMALSSGLKANHVMRCMDVEVPPGDEAFASRMCRDILNTCVRNTEEAEKAAQAQARAEGGDGVDGGGRSKGVLWNMIEDSELAKSIRLGKGQTEMDLVIRARETLERLNEVIDPNPDRSPPMSDPPSSASSGVSTPVTAAASAKSLLDKARGVVLEVTERVQSTADAQALETLLGLCDELNAAIAAVESRNASAVAASAASEKGAPVGLGLHIEKKLGSAADGPKAAEGRATPEEAEAEEEVDEEEPRTPRVDKGKGRAEPEPEQPEKVLSPTFVLSESDDDEDEDGGLARFREEIGGEEDMGLPSPNDRSKSWVEEEGEVFRKGVVLLSEETMEGEYAGEDLKRELLEAMVERPPPRGFIDEYGMEINGPPSPLIGANNIENEPLSPLPNEQQPNKPVPRPYISRSRSASNSVEQLAPPTSTPGSPSLGAPPLSPSLVRLPASPVVPSPSTPTGAAGMQRPGAPARSWSTGSAGSPSGA